jgi:hypothetical protein
MNYRKIHIKPKPPLSKTSKPPPAPIAKVTVKTYTVEEINAIFDERISNIKTELKHTNCPTYLDTTSYLIGAREILTDLKKKFK